MNVTLDHLILPVNELEPTLAFYTNVMGFTHEGQQGPFSVVRVNADLTLQVAPWGTAGGIHLAFALPHREFEMIFARAKAAGIPYGDTFHHVGNMQGPGEEPGARGAGKAVYMFDPSKHLIEIRFYEA